MTYSVHDEPDFARVYDEDEMMQVRRGDLRALLDIATGSMDFGSGFLNNEDVECLRGIAGALGVDPLVVTPTNFKCLYEGRHDWRFDDHWNPNAFGWKGGPWWCPRCRAASMDDPR